MVHVPTDMSKIQPLLINATIPSLILKTISDDDFDLNAAVSKQRTILLFYRGSW